MAKLPTDAQWQDLAYRVKAKADASSVPTKTSDLTNDSDFQTGTQVSSAISTAIAGVTEFDYQVVQTLPASGVKGTIYLVANSGSGQDVYDEYVWVNNAWEKLGATFTLPTASASVLGGVKVGSGLAIDNSGVLTATGVSMKLYNTTGQNTDGAMTQKAASDAIAAKADASALATVATSGNYNDLTNKPTIPTVNNATLTITQNSASVGTFTANSSTNTTIDIVTPVTFTTTEWTNLWA